MVIIFVFVLVLVTKIALTSNGPNSPKDQTVQLPGEGIPVVSRTADFLVTGTRQGGCFLIHLSTNLSHHPCTHPSLFRARLELSSKPTFSTNPSHLRLLLTT